MNDRTTSRAAEVTDTPIVRTGSEVLPPRKVAPWWTRTTVYHVYPRSFADGNADGVGDLLGLTGRLDYLHDLGVETLWLSPFYSSPQDDFGYDITDHRTIDPLHGSQADFDRLLAETHRRGIRIVLDIVLNHTSVAHPWFVDARSSRDSARRDWYIWRDGARPGGKAPPNNWRNMLGGRGWHYDPVSTQWYWASFLPFQPDLNWRNPQVVAEMLDMVRHWLDLGVDGLRLDVFNALFKDAAFANNPGSFKPFPTGDDPTGFFQRPQHTLDHADTFTFSRSLRRLVDEYKDPPRFVVGEVMGEASRLREYCGEDADGLHLVFMFKTMRTRFSASAFRRLIAEAEATFVDPLLPTWTFSNHDRPRAIHRLDEDPRKASLLAMMQLTVRGVPFIYYGEELGLSHVAIPKESALDPVAAHFRWVPRWLARRLRTRGILLNRDECRVPMPWSRSGNAGFTPDGGKPWLPLHPDSDTLSVEHQQGDPTSLLSTYRRILHLRRDHPALNAGRLELLDAKSQPGAVLSYRRIGTMGHGHPDQIATVLLNFGANPVDVVLPPGGGLVHSNIDPQTRPLRGYRRLEAFEGIVVIQAASPT